MAYSDGQFYDPPAPGAGITSTEVPYFSNPSVSYQGVATGHSADGDNARNIREIKHVIAAYRESAAQNEETIWVRFEPGAAGTINSTISNSATGVSSQDVLVTGNGYDIGGENIMKIHDVTASINSTATIELEIINEDEFAGFNLDIPLPAGFNYVPGSAELYRDDGHFLDFEILEGNKARMISAAVPTTPYIGNDGVIISFDVETPASPGTYTLDIENAVIADMEGVNIMTGDMPGTVTLIESTMVTFEVSDDAGVSIDDAIITFDGTQNGPGDYVFEDVEAGTHNYTVERACYLTEQGQVNVGSSDVTVDVTLDNLIGDANNDGEVNVSDVIVITNYFMGQEPEPFCFMNADVNADGVINVQDVIGTTNIFMSGKMYPHDGLVSDQAHLYLYPDGIYLESDGTVTGLQFELEGIMAETFDMELTLPDHQMVYKSDQDVLTAMVFSTSNKPLAPEKTRIVAFEHDQDLPAWGDVLVANVNAEKVPVQTHVDDPTGVQDQTKSVEVNVYPNPAKESIWVELSHLAKEQTNVTLLNIHGQELVSKQLHQAGNASVEINLDNVPSGVYMIKVLHDDETILKKIVVN